MGRTPSVTEHDLNVGLLEGGIRTIKVSGAFLALKVPGLEPYHFVWTSTLTTRNVPSAAHTMLIV